MMTKEGCTNIDFELGGKIFVIIEQPLKWKDFQQKTIWYKAGKLYEDNKYLYVIMYKGCWSM